MFRPNRIGTPYIHTAAGNSSTINFTLGTTPIATGQPMAGNVLNGVPFADFGHTVLVWTGAEALPGLQEANLGFQFTVDKPLQGDTVGLECIGTYLIGIDTGVHISGFISRLAAAGIGAFDSVQLDDHITRFGSPSGFSPNGTVFKYFTYKESIIVQDVNGLQFPGTFMHGINLLNTAAAAASLTYIHASMAIRQLNDQQSIGYRDTLR